MALDQAHRYGHRRSRFSTPSRRRRLKAWIAAGLCMGFVAVVWAWAFQRGPGEGADVPVLTADQPTREKPNDPGGMKVSDIDPLQYDSGRTAPRVENILPGPDKPLPQPAPEQRAATTPSAATDAPPSEAAPVSTAPAQPVQSADAAADGPPLKPAPEMSPPEVKPVAAATPAPPPAKAVAPKAAAARQPEAKPMAVSPGGYRLQLASLKSAADARKVGDKLKHSYGDVLGAVNFSVVQVNLGDRGTYFRVMAGPMSQNSASQVCDALKQRGAACILAKP